MSPGAAALRGLRLRHRPIAALLVAGFLLYPGLWTPAASAGSQASAYGEPLLITSAGQSPGAAIVRMLAERSGLPHIFDAVADSDELDGIRLMVIVVGASPKGMGAAGLNLQDERGRLERLLYEAARRQIPVAVAHVEGAPRRGALSDEFIEFIFPYADFAFVRADGDDDGFFVELAHRHGVALEKANTPEQLEVALTMMWPVIEPKGVTTVKDDEGRGKVVDEVRRIGGGKFVARG